VVDPATDAGTNGEVLVGFLEEALRVVKDDGKVFMLLMNASPFALVQTMCTTRGFTMTTIAERHQFFETLTVFEASGIKEGGLSSESKRT
jgi:hypothetical protein